MITIALSVTLFTMLYMLLSTFKAIPDYYCYCYYYYYYHLDYYKIDIMILL